MADQPGQARSDAAVPARRRLARVRRPQILETAVELLREEGLWSVRVADVAERAGTSPAGVIYYFGTKEELFRAAIESADSEFYATIARELDRLETAVERLAWLMVQSSHSEWVLWMDLWAYARRHPDLLPTQRGFSERWCATIAAIVRYGQARREFTTADADAVAVRLGALTDGLAVHMVLGDEGRTREHYVEMSLTTAAAELGCSREGLLAAAERVPAR